MSFNEDIDVSLNSVVLICRVTPPPQSAPAGSSGLVAVQVPTAVPELVGYEDDPPLQQDGGEHLQQSADAQTLQQAVKVHVLQPGVHGSTQSQLLPDGGRAHDVSVNSVRTA